MEENAADSRLRDRLKQTRPFESGVQEALLSLMTAGASVQQEMENVCSCYDLSASHYNVLRILAGGPPEGYPRCDIIDRMIDRGPDVTRLTDRLEAKGLVERERSEEDRRMTMHRITVAGRALVEEMHEDVRAVQHAFAARLSDEDCEALSQLCAKVYDVQS